MKKKTLLIKTADLCIRIHYKYPYIEQQCETWRVNEGYEPDIEVSVTDEEIETEYAGYRAESVSRALCESTCIYRAIARKLIAFQAFVARRRIGVRRKSVCIYREERSRKDNTYEAVGRVF